MSDQALNQQALSMRTRAYQYFFDENARDGIHASFTRFIFILILLNLFVLMLESAPAIYSSYKQIFYIFDIFSVAVFFIEYLLRVYLAPEDPEFSHSAFPRLRYVTSFMGIVDFLAILPFFLGIFVAIDTRALRALRLLRLLKITFIVSRAFREFRALNQGRTFRQKIHAMLFQSEYGGKIYEIVEIFLIFWIVASVLSIVFESVESIRMHFNTHFFILDVISFFVFATEYVLRIYAFPEEMANRKALMARVKFITSPGGLFDLIAILPFMLEMLLGNFIDLRFLRIVRMVRLLKLGRYSSASDTMFAVIKKEAPVLLASSFVMGLLVFIMAALGYMLERDAQPDKFENIPQALYWAVITLASVGYGDISPITPAGRLITVILALVGIGIFAIPAAIMASGFTDQLRLNREQLLLDLLSEIQGRKLTDTEKTEFIALAKQKHLTDTEIQRLLEEAENKEKELGNDQHESLLLASNNPEYAFTQYRMLLSKISALVAVADKDYITQKLSKPEEGTEVERKVWQHFNHKQ